MAATEMSPTQSSSWNNVVQLDDFRKAGATRGQKDVNEWVGPVMERLNRLAALPKGWDGYDAPPVAFDNAWFAYNMLMSLWLPRLPVPQIVPGVDGDLQIEWHTAAGSIELHVLKPYEVHAWFQHANGGHEEEMTLAAEFDPVSTWLEAIREDAGIAVGAATT